MLEKSFYIERHSVKPFKPEYNDKDVRGLLWCWEPPSPHSTYVVACDPTIGVDNWSRELRVQDDVKIDNAVIQVIKVGDLKSEVKLVPDVQVAEFAAPVDFVQCAEMLNVIGRLYAGGNEDGQALTIIEVYPGPGLMVQRELISTWGYQNLYQQPYLDTRVPQARRGSPFGWIASKQSKRDLWIKGLHHINSGHVRINSPALVEEMADCEPDESRMAMKAVFGAHDDRVTALLLALWAAHHWGNVVELIPTSYKGPDAPKWQASEVSASKMYEQWEERMDQLMEENY